MRIKIAYARKKGTSHLYQQLPCQDYVKGSLKNNTACIALADGAGSVPDSEIAAQAVVEVLVYEFTKHFNDWYLMEDDVFKNMFVDVCNKKVCETSPVLLPTCTALIFAAAKDGRNFCCHIGDGVIFGIDCNGKVETISEPENGEEPNQTFFVSGPDPQLHLRVKKNNTNVYKTIIMCSDGVAGSLWNKFTGEYAPALTRISDWLSRYSEEQVSGRLEEELDKTFREHSQDDMSMAVMHFTHEIICIERTENEK